MADTKISNLAALAAAPATNDVFALVDTSASSTKKLEAKYLVRDSGGSGAVVTGAYTLTIPATGTAALLGTENVFTVAQTIRGQITSQDTANDVNGSLYTSGTSIVIVGANSDEWKDIDLAFYTQKTTGGNGYNEKMRITHKGNVLIGTTTATDSGKLTVNGEIALVDGMTEPGTTSGWAKLYVDSADGDLKIKFGDGTVKTIVVDT